MQTNIHWSQLRLRQLSLKFPKLESGLFTACEEELHEQSEASKLVWGERASGRREGEVELGGLEVPEEGVV